MSQKSIEFETALGQLEEIAVKLENGSTTLSQSIELFEQGMKISKDCGEVLQSAKLKIMTLADAESEAE